MTTQWNNLNRRTAISRYFSRSRRSPTAFRNATKSRRRTHLPRTSQVRKVSRISVGGPFGEVVKKTGVAISLPFGFSTKYRDDETGFLYYGYRFYQSSTGRWLTRDPLGEEAFSRSLVVANSFLTKKLLHLELRRPPYLAMRNSPVSVVDPFGLAPSASDVVDKIKTLIDLGNDLAKEIKDALKNGKANGLTPKEALDQLFGIGQLTDQMVSMLTAFPDNPDCLKMLKAV